VSESGPVGRFMGLTLVNSAAATGDCAFVETTEVSASPTRLPLGGPGTDARSPREPVLDVPVWIWSRNRNGWIPGKVTTIVPMTPIPHKRYGYVNYTLLFGIALADPTIVPMQGDSGGIIVDEVASAIGLLCAGPTYCQASDSGAAECVAYGVPLFQACLRLGVELVVQ
jgi:hypothetical protein